MFLHELVRSVFPGSLTGPESLGDTWAHHSTPVLRLGFFPALDIFSSGETSGGSFVLIKSALYHSPFMRDCAFVSRSLHGELGWWLVQWFPSPIWQTMTRKPALLLACVSQGFLAFLEARLVGTVCLPVVQSRSHASRVGKKRELGTALSNPRVGCIVPPFRTCLQLNALDAFEFDFLFFFWSHFEM